MPDHDKTATADKIRLSTSSTDDEKKKRRKKKRTGIDPRRVMVTGRGVQPKGLRVGEVAVFYIHTREAGEGEPSTSIIGPGGKPVPVQQTPRGNGEYECIYHPNVDGPYKVLVTFGGQDVPRSPFQVMVAKQTTTRVIAYGPGLVGGQVGFPAAFTVDTRGEPDANLGFAIEGPSEAHIDASDNRDGSCRAKYYPLMPGDYIIHITCNNEDIKDSPFSARILPGQGYDVSQVKVSGPGIQPHGNSINKTTELYIYCPGAPPNAPIGVQIVDKDGEQLQTSPVQNIEPERYVVQYTPYKDQKHTIYVTFAEVAVDQSPYQVFIDRGYDLSDVTVRGLKPACKVNVMEEVDIIVPNSGALPSPTATIRSPSRRTVQCVVKPSPVGYSLGYMPEEEGPHYISIFFGSMVLTEGTTIAEIGADPSKVRAYGPGIAGGEVHIPAEFHVNTRGAGTGALGLEIEGPSEAHIECKDDSKGLCCISYLPTIPGEYLITVKFANEHIPGSPFKSLVTAKYDANRVKISGRGLHSGHVRVQDWAEVNIDITGAGEADLTYEVIGPSGNKSISIPDKLEQLDDERYVLKYQPQEEGYHTVAIKYGGQYVHRSPAKVLVRPYVDVSNVKLRKFWTDVFVEGYHDFVVDASTQPERVGNEEVRVVISAPSGKKTAAKVKNNNDGTYEVGYVLKETGPHDLEVTYQGAPIPNSPFRVNASRGRDASRVIAVGPGLKEGIVGQEAHFTVISKNAGPGSLGVYIEGPSEAKTTFKDNKDGTCSLAYLPTKPGEYNITIKYEDEFIPDSPFKAQIYANPNELKNRPDPTKVRVTGTCIGVPEILASEPQQVFVDATDAGHAPLRCAVTDPQKNEVISHIRDNHDGTFNVQWTPEDLGPHVINVLYGGKPAAQSPYNVNARPTGNANMIPAPTIKKKIPVRREYHFQVDATKAGRGQITCSAEGPDGRKYPVLVSARPGHPGMFDCRFTPNFPGNYRLIIKFGGNPVQGSPFTTYASDSPADGVDDAIDSPFGQQPLNSAPFSPGPFSPGGVPFSPPAGAPPTGAMTPCDLKIATEPNNPPGQVQAEVVMPSGRVAVPTVLTNPDGTVAVKYKPTELGKHKLAVAVNGKEIKGSPFDFNVDVISEGRVSAYGPGLTSGIVNQPCVFTVATKAHGPGGLKVSVQGPSRVEVQCHDNGDGTCTCQFVPTAPGDYLVEVSFDGQPVNGAPFTTRVQDPFGAVRQTYIPMGSESKVTLKISEPDISVLTSTIKPPHGPEEPCKLMRMANGSIGVSFTPRQVGEHLVNVFKEGRHIPNSPFRISVSPAEIGDASKVKVWGPGITRAVANQIAKFNIDMSQAGYSNLSLSMEGPSQANLDCSDTENGNCEVSYMPAEPGEYILNIRYGDQHIPGSPFNVLVTGEGSSMMYTERTSRTRQSTSQLADVGSSCELSLNIPGANPADMSAQVISPTGKVERANVGSDGRNKFCVSFIPEENGVHQVHVYHKDREIQGSPFQFTVGPLGEDQGAQAVKAYGPGLQSAEANQPAEFVILTREAGGGSLSVAVEGPAKTEIELEDNKDGSCNILYYPTLPGEYLVNIKFNDQHIPNSPFRVIAVPGSSAVFPQPDTGLVPDQPASFVVTMPNVFNEREIQTRLIGPSGREAPCEVQKLDSQGNYAIKFFPMEEGENRVDVTVWGAHVPGSPFYFKVGDTKGDATRVFADGEGLYRGTTGQPCEFIVNTCNAGKGTLQVTVDGPSRVTMDCKEVEEGYQVRYVAHVPGEYLITIKYAGPYHINGSPFKAVISGSTMSGYSEMQESIQEVVTVDTVAKTYSATHQPRLPGQRPIDPQKVVCRGPGLKRATRGIYNSVQVDASSGGNSMLVIGIQGPSTPVDELTVKHLGNNHFDVRFKPLEPGQHVMVIKWNDQHVPGSPFPIFCQ